MKKNIEKGNTLIVKGPSRITLLEGELEVFGKILHPEKGSSTQSAENFEAQNTLIIPSAHCYPLYARENSQLEIYTNNEENLKLIKENSISDKWIEIKDEILRDLKNDKESPLKIMVLGMSSGKTTLIKYLANN
ncbi:unnamed protein product, partial [marine sediment metagenome]